MDNRADKKINVGVIFIHGAAGCSQVWKNQLRGLPTKVIAVNLPCHFSSEGPESPSMETYVESIYELITKLELDKVILGGHSMGGAIALSYYLRYPSKVHGLILIGTGARLRVLPVILDLTQKNYTQFIKMMDNAGFHKETCKNNKELVKEVAKNMAQIAPHIAFCDFSICNQFDIMERLGEISVPTLIICGDDDKLTPLKYSKYLQEYIKDSTLHIVKEAGHLVMLEKGEEVNTLIKSFIKEI